LDDLCVKHEVDCGAPRTVARLLDKVKNIDCVNLLEMSHKQKVQI